MIVIVYTVSLMVGDLCVDLKFCQSVCRSSASSNCVRLSPSRRGLTSVRVKRLHSKTHLRQPPLLLGANAAKHPCHALPLLTDLRCINLSGICCLRDQTKISRSTKKKYRQLASVSSSVPLDDSQRRNNHEAAPDSPILQKPIVTDEGIVNGFEGTVDSGWGPQQLAVWLQANRYGPHIHTLSTYSGADLLRLTENNLVQLCGLPDGIRLYNVLHSRPIAPKLTLYICVDPRDRVYQAVHLTCLTSTELLTKVSSVLGIHVTQVASFFVEGPNGIKLVLNDQLVSHLNDHSAYSITSVLDGANRFELLLKPSEHNPNP